MTRIMLTRPVAICRLVSIVAFTAALVSQTHAQTAQTRQVMREKLALSQGLLAALVTSNWAVLDKNTQALVAVTKRPGWQVLQAPEYARNTSRFLQATQALADAAIERDEPAALVAYNRLVVSCVGCHRYVARSRLANQ